jgi:hypothetical protein
VSTLLPELQLGRAEIDRGTSTRGKWRGGSTDVADSREREDVGQRRRMHSWNIYSQTIFVKYSDLLKIHSSWNKPPSVSPFPCSPDLPHASPLPSLLHVRAVPCADCSLTLPSVTPSLLPSAKAAGAGAEATPTFLRVLWWRSKENQYVKTKQRNETSKFRKVVSLWIELFPSRA